ncbi:MAG: phosphoribosyltransferase [Zhenhengia sp.]|uniref:phosphoribosyltransferase n=1 Tax=Zhenhengia sp. TaxID=2944208 RepID=UPI0039943893
MEKVLIVSLDVVEDLDETRKNKLLQCFKKITEENNIICFISHDNSRLLKSKEEYSYISKNFKYKNRSQIREIVDKLGNKYFIVLGNVDEDLFLASNKKLLFMTPTWTKILEEKPKKYGLPVNNPKELLSIIKIINNQNYWYAKLDVDKDTTVISLMDGAYKYYSKSPEEKEMIKNFEEVLKRGKTTYFDILLYHFLAGISSNELFKEVTTWCIFPSSKCQLNETMMKFKEHVRYMMNGREAKNNIMNNLFIRHTEITPTHSLKETDRETYGAGLHFESLMIDPAYKSKIKGKTVCVFDDYLNYGNSFEACRHLLKKAGVKKIIFVSLGKFRRNYLYQSWDIVGDVFSKSYKTSNFKVEEYIQHREFEINNKAKDEVENLYNIFNIDK